MRQERVSAGAPAVAEWAVACVGERVDSACDGREVALSVEVAACDCALWVLQQMGTRVVRLAHLSVLFDAAQLRRGQALTRVARRRGMHV